MEQAQLEKDEKMLEQDVNRIIVAHESAGHLAEDFSKHLASEITGFGSMLKSGQQAIRAMEEKLLQMANEMNDVRKANSETASRMAAIEQHAIPALNEKLSRQEELGRAMMAVLDEFRARLSDCPTRGEIGPLWKEAEIVMLDDLNRQRADLRALLATLEEDYRDGALSEKTYLEAKAKTEEKLAVLENKIKRFVAAASESAEAKRAQPAPFGEKEKLAEAKLAELRQREERLGALEKRLEDSSRKKEMGPGVAGGLLGKILSAEEKPAEPRQAWAKVELEAPLAPSIMPLPSHDGGKEARLKREVDELEGALARIREKKSGAAGEESLLLKLEDQKQELETLIKIVEKRHAEGEIASESYESIRARTLERLQKINEMLSSRQKRTPYG